MLDVFKTSLSEAVPPFVLALDVGSTASRGSLYDARGLPIAGSKLRLAHTFTTASDGTSDDCAGQSGFGWDLHAYSFLQRRRKPRFMKVSSSRLWW